MMETTANSQLPDAFINFLNQNGLDPSIYTSTDTLPRYIRLKPGCEAKFGEIEAEFNCKLNEVNWLHGFYSLPSEVQIANSKAYQNGKKSRYVNLSIFDIARRYLLRNRGFMVFYMEQ